ncbi:MAG: alpha/beta hydrolase, partial [Dermatophilaceae bacterium]
MPSNRQVARNGLIAAAASTLAATVLSAAGTVGAATYFARKVLTPDRLKPDDTQILEVDSDSVTLGLTVDSGQPGRYGLWFDDGRGHARVGSVLEVDEAAGRVRRVLEGVDAGELHPGPARWNQYYFA